ncbi:ABC transporter substrate-binding protein, partial [Mesorhizobium sp. M7A.F.Ca.CA.004.05.1.1]
MLKFGLKLAAAATVFAGIAFASPAMAQDGQKTFYLLSHGGPSDAFWLDWNAGATKACDQLKVTCKIS